ncbi:MAG: ferrichrome ABC transporter substrate-binding protein [Lachnospiraceae bacterium]|nr:ferrichrome ABC transporter substrate-binding protein [Lachnospiraceae bacterium]
MKKTFMTAALALALMFSLVGCSSNKGNTESNDNTQTENTVTQTPEASTETRVVTDARGEVEIPVSPKRIVDLSGNSDILSILGYKVAGTANSDAYDYTKFPSYLEETLAGAEIVGYSMQNTMDIEGILALDPDLIIISSVQEKMYEQLQEVAPTVMIELKQLDWTEDLADMGRIFEKEDEANAWLEEYKAAAAATGEQIKEMNGKDATYLAFLASGGQIFIFDGAGVGSVLYQDMGLAKPAGMPEQENISLPVVTYEGLAAIDADYIFAIGTDEDLALLEASSIYQSIEAVKNGKVITLPSSPYFNMGYSPIGRKVFVNEAVSLLESIQ